MNAFLRLFGAGPLGALLTVLSVGLALIARDSYPSISLGLPALFRYLVLVCAGLATVAGVVWSFRSLPVAQRGNALCTQGAYHWVRHPLYASFITVLAPGLAIFLNHWVFLLWLPVLHLLWHLVIVLEERLMAARFGEEYRLHARRTARFVPRFVKPSPA